MEITLCLIVKDEEKQILKCIESFKGLFSGIVIVDTGSKDFTKALAQKKGANVFTYKWDNDFSKARNFALSKVKTDWVLMVDADDRIQKKDKENLIKILKSINKNTFIISCPYILSSKINSKLGQTGYRVRFFKTALGLKFVYPVHEYLSIHKKYQKNHEKTDIPFIHIKKSSDLKKGLSRNIEIMKKNIKKYQKDLRILYYLVHDNYFYGNYKETIGWCQEYIKNNPQNNYKVNKILAWQAVCYSKSGMPVKAINTLSKAIEQAPELIEPYLYLGDILMTNKKYNEAIHSYKLAQTCKYPKNTNMFFNTAAYKYYADQSLTYALPKIGDYKNALKHAKKVQKFLPHDKKLNSHIQFLQSKI